MKRKIIIGVLFLLLGIQTYRIYDLQTKVNILTFKTLELVEEKMDITFKGE